MKTNIDKMLAESVDLALSRISPGDKMEFYNRLKQDYNFDMTNISESFPVFHLALSERYGNKHFVIEREIIKILHVGILKGEYAHSEEIEAFSIVANSYLEESTANSKEIKRKLNESRQRL